MLANAARCTWGKTKVPTAALEALIKEIGKVAESHAPRKQSWTAKRAYNLAKYESELKSVFDAEWDQKPKAEKTKGARLNAQGKFVHAKFTVLPPEIKVEVEHQADELNKQEESRFGFVTVFGS